jgi:hypothetical protein
MTSPPEKKSAKYSSLKHAVLLSLQASVPQPPHGGQLELALVEGPEDMRASEYSVLVTNLDDELVTVMRHYRDRADCENNFDETKNQWGWGGFVTRELQTSQIMKDRKSNRMRESMSSSLTPRQCLRSAIMSRIGCLVGDFG